MKAEDLHSIRSRLLDQRQLVLEEREERQRSAPLPSTGESEDTVDRAELEFERSLNHQILADDGQLLSKIEAALARLEAGNLDRCTHCGQSIPLERLQAKPWASLCLTCQTLKESGQL